MITADPFELLDADECEAIIAAGLASPALRAGHMKNAEGENYIAPEIRRSSIAFLGAEELGELAGKLARELVRLNDAIFHCELANKFQFQFASYDGAQQEFIAWHADEPLWDGHWRGKKLAMVTQLSDPADYDGGVLEIRHRSPTPRGRGITVAFPAFHFHRVTPVTRGWRYSLVTWAHGPHWR